jgi:hypothetical protein
MNTVAHDEFSMQLTGNKKIKNVKTHDHLVVVTRRVHEIVTTRYDCDNSLYEIIFTGFGYEPNLFVSVFFKKPRKTLQS